MAEAPYRWGSTHLNLVDFLAEYGTHVVPKFGLTYPFCQYLALFADISLFHG